jgi:hypothetical protein
MNYEHTKMNGMDLIWVDDVLYPQECWTMRLRALSHLPTQISSEIQKMIGPNPEHVIEFKETLHLFKAVGWPSLARKLLMNEANAVVYAMLELRNEMLTCRYLKQFLDMEYIARQNISIVNLTPLSLLENDMKVHEFTKDSLLHNLRVMLVGEKRARIAKQTSDAYVIWD